MSGLKQLRYVKFDCRRGAASGASTPLLHITTYSTLNPDEFVWSHLKRTGVARNPLRAGEKLEIRVEQHLHEVKKNRRLVRSFFDAPSVAYISDC